MVYVDDIIITGNSSSLIQIVTTKLNATFSLNQLGQFDYFLGLEVNYLGDNPMAKAHAISSPMMSTNKLSKHGVDLFSDPTLYKSIVRALQYASFTRLEINFAINKVCPFMANPVDSHWAMVKCIM